YGSLLSLSGNDLNKRVDFLLDLVGLKAAAEEKVHGYSKGMTQRLAIAQSLLNKPRLLIFDEPMSGLDPLGRKDIRSLIARIHIELPEATIFFSSHILEDVEQLCSMVALLKKGHLQTFCSIEELLRSDFQNFEVSVRNSTESETKTVNGTDALIDFLNETKAKGWLISNISSQRRTLEEALFRDAATEARS
ncbi:ABC transporter ATP-binding protein, partial [bacterium]|nr:ABC transporter ATP-binding protein [bacterium]